MTENHAPEHAELSELVVDPGERTARRRLHGSHRTITIVAVTAVLALAAGIGLSRFIVSPSEAAARTAPPAAGPISVPVELRELRNDVTIRGNASYDEPTDVRVEPGEAGGPAIITGKVPKRGSTVEEGEVLLEVTGRPVILLKGGLPTYRTLRAGSHGPDVVQLKKALARLGHFSGSTKNTTFDSATATAVRALYAQVGYDPPEVGAEAAGAVKAAREGVTSAQRSVAAAERELAQARKGATKSERQAARNVVLAAERTLASAKKSKDRDAIASARDELRLANIQYDEVVAPRDTSDAKGALSDAKSALGDAREQLAEAQSGASTFLPASEIVYLTTTPRRVDEVLVDRGNAIDGPVLRVSGATLEIIATADSTEAKLVEVGAEGEITLPGDETVKATVEAVRDPKAKAGEGEGEGASSDRLEIVLVPKDLTEDQLLQLQGSNVRVRIPVGATDGAVLVVPAAALTAGPGGEARVELLAADGTTSLLVVKTGLAANGLVEVSDAEGVLKEGTLVVVGADRGTPTSHSTSNDDEDEGEEPAEEPEEVEESEEAPSDEATAESDG